MFHKGNVFKEKDRDGWFYGSFMPKGLQQDNRVEIKFITIKKGTSNQYHFQKTATKIDLVPEGEALWEIEGKEVRLAKGDYVIVPPKVKTRIKNVVTIKAVVQTIKLPSIPNDKQDC